MAAMAEMIAKKIQAGSDSLAKAFAKMPAERTEWKPTVEGNAGRDALDQVLECACLAEWATKGYTAGDALPPIDWDDFKVQCDARRNSEDALAWLKSSHAALVSTISALSDEQIGKSIPHPFYEASTTWGDFAIDLVYWNLVYHEGQINYIQVLYGDNS